ncbi:hypothetical protein [Vibrio sp. F13]|nr:hypothetical protein [Vibrio sp. F13]
MFNLVGVNFSRGLLPSNVETAAQVFCGHSTFPIGDDFYDLEA